MWRYLFVLTGLASCTTIRYSEKAVFKSEKRGYQVVYNGHPVAFKNIILNKDSITRVKKNYVRRRISIYPTSVNAKFKTGEELVNEIRVATGKEFDIIVINGVPYFKAEELKLLQVQQSAGVEYIILDPDKFQISCNRMDNPLLLIVAR
ncbi:MAG: hypothetical protein H6Q26_67 [Bacteroidetes bacterium]|uniref:hypothetical protein n=1 Tax=Chitinophaga sp. LS1 TaxID=3051176 RepID=UPI001D857695|nr:hypothetical protein [Chitinophaga sp. LS1]MBP1649910.1 hypothetical protein [Bacteroidota bacterium]WPV65757.1 hypothetical protein QQL36_28560 [Chitinophaga sp. LS1]